MIRFAHLLVLLSLLQLSRVHAAELFVGKTDLNVSANHTGSAIVSVPLATIKPGNGFQLPIALTYSSSVNKQGDAGFAWNLTPKRYISRCRKNHFLDGQSSNISFSTKDALCLDGKSLVLVSGTHLESGAEYRLRQENFSKITLEKNDSGSLYFKVWEKSGDILKFGSTQNSRDGQNLEKTLHWYLDEVKDRSGNFISLSYFQSSGEGSLYLKSIAYGGNQKSHKDHYLKTVFEYDSAINPQTHYVSGKKTIYDLKLASIKHFSLDHLAWYYTLTHSNMLMGVGDKLDSIQQCITESQCLPPSVIEYQEERFAIGKHEIGQGWHQNDLFDAITYGLRRLLDIDQDGYQDIVSFYNEFLWVQHGYEGGFKPVKNYDLGLPETWSYMREPNFFTDIDKDGYQDFITTINAEYPGGEIVGVYVSYGNKDGFEKVRLLSDDFGKELHPKQSFFTVIDMNGDHLHDIALFDEEGVKALINQDNRTFKLEGPEGYLGKFFSEDDGWTMEFHPRYFIDVNSDGITDVIGIFDDGVYVALGNGSGFNKPQMWSKGFGLDPGEYDLAEHAYRFADMNSDGLIDIVGFHNEAVKVGINTGKSFAKPEVWLSAFGSYKDWLTPSRNLVDINGDGFVDFVGVQGDYGSGRIAIYLGRGRPLDKSIPPEGKIAFEDPPLHEYIHQKNVVVYPDLDGDGYRDIRYVSLNLSGYQNKSQKLLVNKVVDGFGQITRISYGAPRDADTYINDKKTVRGSDLQILPKAGIVVKKIERENSLGHKQAISYKYYNAVLHLRGMGFLGFEKWESFDETHRVLESKEYIFDLEKMEIGYPSRERTYQVALDGAKILRKQVEFLWDYEEFSDQHHRFSYLRSQETKSYDHEGQFISTATVDGVYDRLGRLLKTTATKVGHSQSATTESSHTYVEADFDRWIFNSIAKTVSVHKKPGKKDIKETVAFEYDSDGLLTATIHEPGTGLERKVEYSRQFSYFGQISDTVTSWSPEQGEGLDFAFTSSAVRFDQFGYPRESLKELNYSSKVLERDSVYFWEKRTQNHQGLSTSSERNAFGQLIRETDPYGISTDTIQQWCKSTECPKGAVYSVTVTSPISPETISFIDSEGRTLRSRSRGFDGQWILQDVIYGQNGKTVATSLRYKEGQTPTWIQHKYDDYGDRLLETVYPDGTSETFDSLGFVKTTINRKGQKFTRTYDIDGKVSLIEDTLSQFVRYDYDSKGRVTSITTHTGQQTNIEYDLYGRRILVNDPSTGINRYRYNALDGVAWAQDAKGTISRTFYDALGRKISQEVEGDQGKEISDWTFYEEGVRKGLSKQELGPKTAETYLYDELGRVKSYNISVERQDYTMSYGYDLLSRPTLKTYPSGLKTELEFNQYSYQSALKNAQTGKVYSQTLEVNVNGQATTIALGALTLRRQYDYLDHYLLSSSLSDASGAIINRKSFEYDSLGNLVSRELAKGLEAFEYDDLNRLISYTKTDGEKTSVEYGPEGNILSRSDLGPYTYGESCGGVKTSPYAVSSVGKKKYCYNKLGQMIRKGDIDLTYGYDGLLRSMKDFANSVKFTYTPGGSKVKQQRSGDIGADTSLFVGDSYQLVEKDGKMKELHFIGGMTLVTLESGQLSTSYLAKDNLGSTTEVFSEEGKLLESMQYDPWGVSLNGRPETTSGVGFTGHSHIGFEDLIHMKGRVYDAEIGRFLSPDPFVQAPESLQSFNRYSYVWNNPLTNTDPSGYFGFNPLKQIARGLSDLGRDVTGVFERAAHWCSQSQNQRMVAAIAITAATGYGIQHYILQSALTASWQQWAVATVASGLGGYASGMVASNGNAEYAKVNALTAMASLGIGEFVPSNWYSKGLAHGVVGGLSSHANGGSFKSGFISSGLTASFTHSSALNGMVKDMGCDPNSLAYLALSSSMVGGTIAELTGGSFEQGAQMAATQAVLNKFLHSVYEKAGQIIEETIYVRDNDPNEACYGYKNGQVISRKVIYERGLQDDVVSEILVTGGASLLRSGGRALGGAIMSRAGAKGLGTNPFKGKTFKQIDEMLRAKGFKAVGKDPATGKGSYLNPKTGRKYYLDKGKGGYKGGMKEYPHVDVHRNVYGRPSNTLKRKYPLGDRLYGPE